MPRKRGAGEGSISRRTDGRWQASYTQKLPDGTSKRRFIYGKTRKAVADELTRILNEINRGMFINPSKVSTGEYLEYWLYQVAQSQVRATTFSSYEVGVRLHLKPDLGAIPLQQLSLAHIEIFKNKKLETLAPSSVIRILAILRNALKHAVRGEYIPRNPVEHVSRPRIPHAEMRRLTPQEATRLLEVAKGHRLEALYILALSCALRRGELLGLHWADVDFTEGVMHIRYSLVRIRKALVLTEPKSKSGRRIIRLPDFAIEALQERMNVQKLERAKAGAQWEDNDLVFTRRNGRPIEPRSLGRYLDTLVKKAGLEHLHVHGMRHSSASFMEAMGVSLKTLSAILGHADVRTTANLYVHPFREAMEDAADKMNSLLGHTMSD